MTPEIRGLDGLASSRFESALRIGDFAAALAWLNKSPSSPATASNWYRCAKAAMQKQKWDIAIRGAENAIRIQPLPLFQNRLKALRARRDPKVTDRGHLRCAERLPLASLRREVAGVIACGRYISRGSERTELWSELIRDAKNENRTLADRRTAAAVGGQALAYVLQHETLFVAEADVVLAIPPDPTRFAGRGLHLPGELAAAVEHYVAIPMLTDVLKKAKDIELRGLSHSERRRAVEGSMMLVGKGPLPDCVLLVDDVITSGATLREAARVLKRGGVREVYAACLSHTEG